jgi:hypothetical protein
MHPVTTAKYKAGCGNKKTVARTHESFLHSAKMLTNTRIHDRISQKDRVPIASVAPGTMVTMPGVIVAIDGSQHQ